MRLELDSIEIEDFALLKFSASPDWSQRWQMRADPTIGRAQSDNDRPVLERHREQMINRFEVARKKFFLCFFDFLFHVLDQRLHSHLFLHLALEPCLLG